MVAMVSDRWLFDHVSALTGGTFSALSSERSPRGVWNLVKIENSTKHI